MRFLLLILLTLQLSGQAPSGPPQAVSPTPSPQKSIWDKFPDDAKHFYAGFFISVITGEIVYYYTESPTIAAISGVIVGTGIGALKEYVWDGKMGRGVKNNADFLTTMQGAIIGGVFQRCWRDWRDNKAEQKSAENDRRKHLLD